MYAPLSPIKLISNPNLPPYYCLLPTNLLPLYNPDLFPTNNNITPYILQMRLITKTYSYPTLQIPYYDQTNTKITSTAKTPKLIPPRLASPNKLIIYMKLWLLTRPMPIYSDPNRPSTSNTLLPPYRYCL